MKTPTQRAIELAIEGGWNPTEEDNWIINGESSGVLTCHWYSSEYPEEGTHQFQVHEMLLDPDFWKCLGKALGWEGNVAKRFLYTKTLGDTEVYDDDRGFVFATRVVYEHHRLIDALHKGKTIDEALESIIGKEV